MAYNYNKFKAKKGVKRKPKVKPTYNGIEFDSTEEVEFYMWLEEAQAHSLIGEFEFHGENLEIIGEQVYYGEKKTKKKGWHYTNMKLKPCTYELDFKFKPTQLFTDTFFTGLVTSEDGWIYVDTKGSFKARSETVFSMKRKFVYQQYKKFVNRVCPIEFFALTWRPEKAGLQPKRGFISKPYLALKTYKDLRI